MTRELVFLLRLTAEITGICLLFSIANGRFEFAATNWTAVAFFWMIYATSESYFFIRSSVRNSIISQLITALLTVLVVWLVVSAFQSYLTLWQVLLGFMLLNIAAFSLAHLLKLHRPVSRLKLLSRFLSVAAEVILVWQITASFLYGWRSERVWLSSSEFVLLNYFLVAVLLIFTRLRHFPKGLRSWIVMRLQQHVTVFSCVALAAVITPLILVKTLFSAELFYLDDMNSWGILAGVYATLLVLIFSCLAASVNTNAAGS